MLPWNEGEWVFFGTPSKKEPRKSLPSLVFKDKAVLSWVQKKVLASNVFNFFALNELKFSQTRFLRFGKKKGSLPSPGEAGQVSSWQERFCQSYKNWSESNGAVSGIYKAASSQKILKHITYSRLDSPALSHTLLIHIVIKTYIIWELGPEGLMQEHMVWNPSRVSRGGNSLTAYNADSVYNEYKCQPSKPSWRGMLPISKPAWSKAGLCGSVAYALPQGRGYQKQGLPPAPLGSWCWLMTLLTQVSSSIPYWHGVFSHSWAINVFVSHVFCILPELSAQSFHYYITFSKTSLGFKIIPFSAWVPPLIIRIYIFPMDGTGISYFLCYVFA